MKMKNTVYTNGISKAAILAALYNNARTGILGALWAFLAPEDQEEMSVEEAKELIYEEPDLTFDFIGVKCLMVDLTDDNEFNSLLYDKYNGSGAAEAAIAPLRKIYAACA